MKERQEKESFEIYLNKIKEMEDELQMLRLTTNDMGFGGDTTGPRSQEEMESMREDLNLFQSKYEELLRLFRRTEDKSKRDEKEIKYQLGKIRELEDLLSEIVEKIGKLPSTTKDLKYCKCFFT